MWVLAMFDLPVDTPEMRRRYTQFRKALLKDGFMMLQFSVYGRFCENEAGAEVHSKRIKRWVPEDGEVRVLQVTDRLFARMDVIRGKRSVPPEEVPPLLLLM